jgi:hypothetical protein
MQAANGLSTGQYVAPEFAFIFPENTQKGEPLVPNDFWHLGFLINREGPGTGPLTPAPPPGCGSWRFSWTATHPRSAPR